MNESETWAKMRFKLEIPKRAISDRTGKIVPGSLKATLSRFP